MRWLGLILIALLAGGTVPWLSSGARPSSKVPVLPAVIQDTGVQDILFLDDHRPVLLRLRIDISGQPFDALWRHYVHELFAYLDVDGDGVLSPQEARRAPSAAALREASNSIFNRTSDTATFLEMDANRDGKVTLDELRHYYRRNGAGSLQVSQSLIWVRPRNPITERLFTLLDANKDGKLSRAEVDSAARVLRPLDRNDDELVSVDELNSEFRNLYALDSGFAVGLGAPIVAARQRFVIVDPDERPGRIGRLLLSRYAPAGKPAPAKQSAPVRLFSDMLGSLPLTPEHSTVRLGPKQLNLDPEVFRLLDRNGDGVLDGSELEAFCRRPADVELHLSLGEVVRAETGRGNRLGQVSPAATGVVLTLGRKQIHVRGEPDDFDPEAAAENDRGFREFLVQQFRAADVKERGYVQMQDLTNPQDIFIRTLFRQADRNGDGRLTVAELGRYFDLRQKAIGAFVVVALADLGRGLFEVLDTDRDGALGVRELRQAWQHLSAWDRNHDGVIEAAELPQQFQVTVTRMEPFNGRLLRGGYALNLRRQAPTRGPLWFRKMDRNGDGDVSPREFLGTAEDFRRIDTDGDGLIDLHEAEQADKRFRR